MALTKQEIFSRVCGGLAITCGLSGVLLISAVGVESGVDERLSYDVKDIAVSVDRAILSQGDKSHATDVKDLKVPISLKGQNNSIMMAGTFKDGYCVVGKNPGGSKAESGIFYSVSSEGKVSTEKNSCTDALDEASLVYGPAISEDIETEQDISSISGYLSGGSLSGLTLAGVGNLVVGKIRSRKRGLDEEESPDLDSKIDSPDIAVNASADNLIESTAVLSSESSATPSKFHRLSQKLDKIKHEWVSYELDLMKILEYPAVTNMNIPATFEFHKSMRKASHLLSETDPTVSNEIKEFEEAVLDVEHRFEVMIAEAKRLKWNDCTEKERVSLQMAQSLLAIASNSASSPHERQIAYKRLMKEVEGIIILPEKSIAELEAKISLAIDSLIIRETVVV